VGGAFSIADNLTEIFLGHPCQAKKNQEGIVLERLKGIRYAHRKGDGEGPKKRRRIALWPFRQLQGYIEYKARWEGVPVEYVSASKTSQTCHVCGYVNGRLKVTERSGYALVMPLSTAT
jgi:IS605 OrfB family transposase